MPKPKDPKNAELDVPRECKLLQKKWSEQRPPVPIKQLKVETGLSVTSVTAAINGYRFVAGEGVRVVTPTDTVLFAVAGAIGVTPAELREVGRGIAADMLEQAKLDPAYPEATVRDDQGDTAAALAAMRVRRATLSRVLSVFTDEELREELARREAGQK